MCFSYIKLSKWQIRKSIELQNRMLQYYLPPIPLTPLSSKCRKQTKNEERAVANEIGIELDPLDTDGETIKKVVKVLEQVDPEAWVLWHMKFDDIVHDVPLTKLSSKVKVTLQFLKGTPREYFQNLKDMVAENRRCKDDDKINNDELLSKVFNLVAKDIFKMEHAHR
jgi:hypothetical protein